MQAIVQPLSPPLGFTMLADFLIFPEDVPVDCSDVLFHTVSMYLEKNLKERASALELRKKNIMKADYIIAPAIQAVQQQLKFQQISDKLEHKLEMRPSRQQLLDCNIIQDSSDAERIQQFHQKVDALHQQLENRPERKFLQDNNIIKGDVHVSGNLQALQQKLKFQKTVDSIDHLLEHRPSANRLVDNNIIKGFSSWVAPTLYGAKHQIEFQQTSQAVGHKLNHRPSPDSLSAYTTILPSYYLQTNVFEPETFDAPEDDLGPTIPPMNVVEDIEPIIDCPQVEPVHFWKTAQSLEHFLEHRPNKDTLLEHNILKGHTGVAATLQANTQKLERKLHENFLNSKLGHRPDINQLKSLNILPREQGHVSAMNRKQRSNSLNLRMENRPTAEEVPYLTPPCSPSTSPSSNLPSNDNNLVKVEPSKTE